MALAPETFNYVRDLVLRRSAIVLEPGKEYLVEARLTALAHTTGFETVAALVAELGRSTFGSLHRQVVEAMTTNETSFYRDAHPFEMLRETLIPRLIAARATERRLSIWCAAASTGQEPYSVAILLREHFPELRGWQLEFVATDLATAVLAKARAGRYTQLEVNRGLPAALLVKYFTKVGMDWQINDDIRTMVEYKELNLVEMWPARPPVDIVMMRNVLIYFDVATKREILRKVRGVMAPHGFLMLGGAETTMAIDDQFVREQSGRGSAYRLAPVPESPPTKRVA